MIFGRTRFVACVASAFVLIVIFFRNGPVPTSSQLPNFWPSLDATKIADELQTVMPDDAVQPATKLQLDFEGAIISSSSVAESPTTVSRSAVSPTRTRVGKPEVEDWTGVDVYTIPDHYPYNDVDNVHHRISSVSTADQKYFLIEFGSSEGYNPSIIPHHTLDETFIIVAQLREHSVNDSVWWAEISCNARFSDGVLKCVKEPLILPVAATFGDLWMCPEEAIWTTYSVGPHDARVFWGPKKPYIVYGSNSLYACMGQWIQDFRLLIDYGLDRSAGFDEFKMGTEMQRPDKYNYMEKNWFVFWNNEDEPHVHHDVWPKRVFAKLNDDGSVGPDLAPAAKDDKCMESHMPVRAKVLEGIHQSTNSLKITLCNRADPDCRPTNENTVIFTIFQHKSYYQFHGNYEPYVMAFRPTAPFSLYGISKKPFFINGRTRPSDPVRPPWLLEGHYGQTEMFYVTSMSWRGKGQRYHGYLDDVVFIAFGIEDQKTAGIDVPAGELFTDMGRCSEV